MRTIFKNLFFIENYNEKPEFEQHKNLVSDLLEEDFGNVKNTELILETNLRVITNSETFLVSNVTGYVLLRLHQILYFEYNRTKRLWEIVLTDGNKLQLKKKTNAEMILSSSTQFIQLNLHNIVNLNHFSHITDNLVYLNEEYNEFGPFKITRYHLRMLQDRFTDF